MTANLLVVNCDEIASGQEARRKLFRVISGDNQVIDEIRSEDQITNQRNDKPMCIRPYVTYRIVYYEITKIKGIAFRS